MTAVDDAEAIRALIAASAARLDAGDLDGVAELFADATWRSGSGVRRGVVEVRAAYGDVLLYHDGPGTRHVMGDVVVDVDGDRATSRCSFTVFQARPDFPLQAILVGRHHDAFVGADGPWRFVDREIRADLIGDLSHHLRHAAR